MKRISTSFKSTILETMKVLFVYKQVNGCQGDGFRAWMHKWAPQILQWLVLKIGGADFLYCWVTDSIASSIVRTC